MIPPTPEILEQISAICSSLPGSALYVWPDNSSCSVTALAPNSNPTLATDNPLSASLCARASATPHESWVITIVPPIGRPSAIAGQGSTSTCHRRVVEEVDVACGTGSAVAGAAGAGVATGAGAGATSEPPPFILTMYETK